MVALNLAMRHPDVVDRLVLNCTSPGGAHPSYPAARISADSNPTRHSRHRMQTERLAVDPEADEPIPGLGSFYDVMVATSRTSPDPEVLVRPRNASSQREPSRRRGATSRTIGTPTLVCAGRVRRHRAARESAAARRPDPERRTRRVRRRPSLLAPRPNRSTRDDRVPREWSSATPPPIDGDSLMFRLRQVALVAHDLDTVVGATLRHVRALGLLPRPGRRRIRAAQRADGHRRPVPRSRLADHDGTTAGRLLDKRQRRRRLHGHLRVRRPRRPDGAPRRARRPHRVGRRLPDDQWPASAPARRRWRARVDRPTRPERELDLGGPGLASPPGRSVVSGIAGVTVGADDPAANGGRAGANSTSTGQSNSSRRGSVAKASTASTSSHRSVSARRDHTTSAASPSASSDQLSTRIRTGCRRESALTSGPGADVNGLEGGEDPECDHAGGERPEQVLAPHGDRHRRRPGPPSRLARCRRLIRHPR